MTIREYSKNYSNIFNAEQAGFVFPTYYDIYKESILSWDQLYKSIAIISVESSNSFRDCENMEFFKYYAISKYVIEYLEEKAKQENGEGTANTGSEHEKMLSQAQNSVNGMKNSFKPPSLSNFKK